MSEFKEVLELEKKYEHKINSAKKKYEKRLDEFKQQLSIKEEAMKDDLKKELDRDFKKDVLEVKKQGRKLLDTTEKDCENIINRANKKKVVNMIVEEIKNV